MLRLGIIDDGVGFVPTLIKMQQVVSAEFICVVCDGYFPLGDRSPAELMTAGSRAVRLLADLGCDAAIFSSVSLSSRCCKALSASSPVTLFGCDAPVLHASTYTASHVLLVGDAFALRNQTLPGLIVLPMPQFPLLAEEGNDRNIVRYISDMCECHSGNFDCIALADSSMNMYKHCFARVFPNVKIFDSLEGVARRIRKTYRKYPREDSVTRVIDLDGNDLSEKYAFFTE